MAAETFRIEIPVHVDDQTDPGASSATRKINSFDKAVQKSQQRLDKMNRTKYEVALEALDKASGVVSRLGASLKGIASKTWRITMGVLDKATAPLRGIINILRNPILQAGAVLGVSVGLKDTIDTYKTFEATMSKVQAISSATAEQMELLNAKAKEMGATTKFTASEAGDAFSYMAMAGWKTEDMLNGIEGIMSLAAASGEDLATTSDIVTDALTAFGLTAKDSGHFADVLAKASSNANTNVSMMGESFKYVAPIAGALGYSVEDVSLALGLMANASVKGSMAGTSLKTALANMSAPTDKMADLMDKLGISLTNAQGNMKPMRAFLDDLRLKMGKLSESEKTAAASTLFGKEAMSGMLAIINASEEDYNKLAKAVDNADGAAQEMADTMLDNLAGSMTLLQSAADGVKLSIGERLKPYLQTFVTWLTQKMPAIEAAAMQVMDTLDEKIAWLKDTVNEFMSGEDWQNADIWGKLAIAWDKIVAEPFNDWWSGTGKTWLTQKMQDFGKTLGSGITAGLLALLGIDASGALADGKTVGGAFIDGFKKGFDTEKITEALKSWAEDHKGAVAALGVVAGGKLLGGIAKGIRGGQSFVGDIKSILGIGSGKTGMSVPGAASYATSTMSVTASVVNVYGNGLGQAARAVTNSGLPSLGGGALPALGGAASPLALPGGTAATAGGLTSATGLLGKLLQLGSTSSVIGADGTLLSVSGGVGGALGGVGTALGSGATTAAGAAAAGAGGVLGGIGGLIGIGAGLFDIFKGTKTSGKDAQDAYSKGGTKIGMVGAGAAAGAAIGSAVPVLGTAVGALVGAGVGGIGALGLGDKIGQVLSDALDEGGWLNNMGQAISTFFTETLPDAWNGFWERVGNFFTETVPYALGYAIGKVQMFFTETIPKAWNDFWGGLWDKISGWFSGAADNLQAGYADATGGATAHAWGGIMTKPHLGLVAEDGAESIIPLSPSKRSRGLDLWEQTGQALGVHPYADGGIIGDTDEGTESIPISTAGTGGGGPSVHVTLQMAPEFVIEAAESGMDEASIIAVIKAHIKEMVDDISDELAERIARIFANMPVKGGA